jgi:hypothetical protein
MSYQIIFSSEADRDMVQLEQHIREELKSPFTAAKYMNELDIEIKKLAAYADMFAANRFIQARFGTNARHATFKKMAIIYILEGSIVYILRVIPGSLIY